MAATSDTNAPAYEPPRLRPLGGVHELTQTLKPLGSGDGLLYIVNGS